jgi:hypothetical protein
MTKQRENPKKTAAPTREQPTKTSVKSPVHPVEEMQAVIGNRAMGQYIQSQGNHRSSPKPQELTLPSKITPIQAKPQFAGISSELREATRRKKIQPKLTIGEPGDHYEQEADRVAAVVVNRIITPRSNPSSQGKPIQRKADTEEDDQLQMKPIADTIQRQETPDSEEDDELQMKPMLQHQAGMGDKQASSDLQASIQRLRGSGQPLAKQIREPMEQAFGANFSGVRVHTDAQSDGLNQSIQAKAFTTGQDVFFRQGAYKPESRDGQELIAHELTHVVQQRGNTIQRKTRNLDTTIKSHLTTKTKFTGKTNTEKIYKYIEEYNKIDINEKQDYEKQKSILKKIIKAGQDWKTKRINPSFFRKIKNVFVDIKYGETEKLKTIENLQQDAVTELQAIEHIESQVNSNSKKEENNSKIREYAKEVGGGLGGKKSEGLNVYKTVKTAITASQLPTHCKNLFEGAKKVAEQPAKNTLKTAIEAVKNISGQPFKKVLGTIIEAGESIYAFASKWGILDLINLPFFLWDIKTFKQTFYNLTALEYARYGVGARKGKNEAKEGDETLQEALTYGYEKVIRRLYSKLYSIVMGTISILNRIVTLLSGFTIAPINAAIELGQAVLNVITTAYRKFKGMYKLLKGKRGAHRKQSAETILKAALNKDEVALQLMVDLEIKNIKDTEEMFKYITISKGFIKPSGIIEALADKLKSQ